MNRISSRSRRDAAIFWISLLGLYLELLFIRWIGTEIRIFAYLQNTVLVVCFLGLGIGFFTSKRPITVHRGLFALAVLAAVLAIPQTRLIMAQTSSLLSILGDLNIWDPGSAETAPRAVFGVAAGLGLTFWMMILVLEPFIPIGRQLGRLLDEHPRPIVAYSVNVAGSLAGIWLFVILSRLSQPPFVWFVVLTVLVLPVVSIRRPFDWLALLLLFGSAPLVFLAQEASGAIETFWSPYQKLQLFGFGREGTPSAPTVRYQVQVNNAFYQFMLDLSTSGAGSHAGGDSVAGLTLSTYDVPALVHPRPDEVLVVGSGTGNDVAGLLRNGAGHVTAVDIDPVILSLGREFHPERPYDSDRVEIVTTDARSFFAHTKAQYDLIVFGFLDSHTTTSLTNARLDHYVYTEESFRHVRTLLRPGGILCLTFTPVRPFIADASPSSCATYSGIGRLPTAFPSMPVAQPGCCSSPAIWTRPGVESPRYPSSTD